MKTTNTYDSTYANMIIEKYEKAIWKRLRKKMPGYRDNEPYIQDADREDVFNDVVLAWLEIVDKGKFKGEHGEASALACIYDFIEKEGNNFFRKRKEEDESVLHEPFHGHKEEIREPWLTPLKDPDPKLGFMPEESQELKEKDEILYRETKHPDILRLRKEDGCTIPKIASILGLTEGQVRGRISRERERLSKETKSLGWADTKPDLDESIKLLFSPSPYFNHATRKVEPSDFKDLGYALAFDERKIKKNVGFRKRHIKLINKMRKRQNAQFEKYGICVKCGKKVKKKDAIIDNTLSYCKECHGNLKKT